MRIKLKYPDVDTFLQKYGPNISRGGIFISTKVPRAVGTPIRFDFVLVHDGEERSVLRGEGTVHFVKEADPRAPTRPQGMGIKFVRLFDDGQALIDRALQLRGAPPEPPPRSDLPEGVREVTGEVVLANPSDISSGEFEVLRPSAHAASAAPPPDDHDDAPAHDLDLDALAHDLQVSPDRVSAVLRRARVKVPSSDDELESLLTSSVSPVVSSNEAAAGLEQLLARRRK